MTNSIYITTVWNYVTSPPEGCLIQYYYRDWMPEIVLDIACVERGCCRAGE
ncbi:MAG: hypothetical protein M8353_06460 [ANME-2 cluster archaeon]|nr:hypothetical protein [ANME-2 cluster archaeon]